MFFTIAPADKRPSYIKELSERVEKMESRQAAIGQPGYRQSFDGASIPDMTYSPDDPMSGKRQFSFSSDARNPFAPTDYRRERMPSAGGAWSNVFPASLVPRDRGSLALAPDQRLPGAVSIPLWGDVEDLEPPPAKRQKTDTDSQSVKVESAHITNYEDAIHPNFPLLPNRETTSNKILAPAQDTESLKVFATIVSLLPSGRTTQRNGNSANIFVPSGLFASAADLSSSLEHLIRETPTNRTNNENIILMWSCTLLALQREYDVRTNRSDLSFATRSNLLKTAMELAEYSLEDKDPIIRNAAKQAKTLTNIMTRFDWFASGAERNWSKTGFKDFRSIPALSRDEYTLLLPGHPNAAFLVRATRSFKLMQTLIQSPIPSDSEFALQALNDSMELSLSDCLDAPDTPAGIYDNTFFVRQVFEYIRLIQSPYHSRPMPPMVIMQHACQLAKLLAEENEGPNPADNPFRYNLIDYHLFTITVITLLAFLDKVPDAPACHYAEEALSKLQPAIEQKLATYQDAIKKREQEGGRYPEFFGKDAEGKEIQNRTWMEALLEIIDDRSKEKWAISKESAQAQGGQAGQAFLEDFLALVRTGYGRVLAGYAGREAGDPAQIAE